MLLTRENHICPERNPISDKMKRGDIEWVAKYPQVYKIPSCVHPFLFRNRDMYDITRHLSVDGV